MNKQEQLIKFGIALKNRRQALNLSLRDVEKLSNQLNHVLEDYFKNDNFDFSYQLKINMLYLTLNMIS